MSDTRRIGKEGEDICCQYLQDNGYTIVERNFRCKEGEIDIIARDKTEWVFLEVKTRTNAHYGYPADAITEWKKRKMMKAVKFYLYFHRLEDAYIRIDMIEVHMEKEIGYIHHIKQVV